jgi:adenosylmethionine-8-amino-7-oxononanoate aminotransferase
MGRWQSYHGNTLGSLSAGGDVKRRQPFTQILLPFVHVFSPHCSRCPYHKEYSECSTKKTLPCVEQVEQTILEVGPEFISSFICEPIVGSQQGAVVPPEDYFAQIREICNKYDILLIIDEVMTGFGRTGRHFAIEHFGIEPDIITFGKGVSSGYAPLGGMIVHDHLIDALLKNSNGKFIHGYTYSGHPVSVAAGLEAVKFYKQRRVLDNCVRQSEYLIKRLESLRSKHRIIGEIRGKGLLIGLELLQDNEEGKEFPSDFPAAERLNSIAMEHGAVFYPGSGSINGVKGQHLLIAPPLTITQDEIDEMINILDQSLQSFAAEFNNNWGLAQ